MRGDGRFVRPACVEVSGKEPFGVRALGGVPEEEWPEAIDLRGQRGGLHLPAEAEPGWGEESRAEERGGEPGPRRPRWAGKRGAPGGGQAEAGADPEKGQGLDEARGPQQVVRGEPREGWRGKPHKQEMRTEGDQPAAACDGKPEPGHDGVKCSHVSIFQTT